MSKQTNEQHLLLAKRMMDEAQCSDDEKSAMVQAALSIASSLVSIEISLRELVQCWRISEPATLAMFTKTAP